MPQGIRISDICLALFEFVSILLFSTLVGAARPLFDAPSWKGPALITVVYVLLCVALVAIRRIKPAEGARKFKTGWLGLPGVMFGFFVLYVAAESGGFFQWVQDVDTTNMPWWIAFAAIGGIGLAITYLVILAVDIQPSIECGTRQLVIRIGCMVVAQAMIVILAAYFEFMGAGSTPEPMGLGGKILIFFALYLFFLLFMATPRLLLLAQDPTPVAVLTFLCGTGYYVWSTLTGTVW